MRRTGDIGRLAMAGRRCVDMAENRAKNGRFGLPRLRQRRKRRRQHLKEHRIGCDKRSPAAMFSSVAKGHDDNAF